MVTKWTLSISGHVASPKRKLYDVSNDVVGFDSTRAGKLLFWFERSADGRVIPVVNSIAELASTRSGTPLNGSAGGNVGGYVT